MPPVFLPPVEDAAMHYKYLLSVLCRQSEWRQVRISAQMTICRNVPKSDIMTLENKQFKFGVRMALAALV
jgi:hypothetical protein